MKIKLSIFLIVLVFCNNLTSQSIKRQNICGNCMLSKTPIFRLSQTAAGCPGCDVLKSATAGYLRQGYQQPNIENNGNNNNANCAISIGFISIKQNNNPCGESFDLTFNGIADSSTSFLWDFGPNSNTPISTDKNPTGIGFFNTTLKTITLTITSGNCVLTASKILNPTGIIKGAKSDITDVKCKDDRTGSVNLTLFSYTSSPTFIWSNGQKTKDISALAAGTYSCTINDNSNCNVSLKLLVKEPVNKLSIPTKVVQETCDSTRDASITITPEGGTKPYTYLWNNGLPTASITNLTNGSYTVKVKDANNCAADSSFNIVTICKNNNGIIPVIFTPNGDGTNDFWNVPGLDKFPNAELNIFNRWGSIVYTKKNFNGQWNGNNTDSDELESATYYYIINLNNTKKDVWYGYITLIR
jgi:gliding motility-associated-like protein